MSYWLTHDAVTFLVDLGIYDPALRAFLTNEEKERELCYKPAISRQRFVLSRTVLKHILSKILQNEDNSDSILIRKKAGRILVKDQPHVYICLAYSGTCIAITVGKRKLGSDIERVRPVQDKKITAGSLFKSYACTNGRQRIRQIIHLWTLVESYAKLYDKNPYPLLNCDSFPMEADFVSYLISNNTIFTLASAGGHLSDALVWLDPQETGTAGQVFSG